MARRDGIPIALLETEALTTLNTAPALVDLEELFAEAASRFPGLGAGGGLYFRVSVTGAAGVRILQGDATVIAGGGSSALPSLLNVMDATTLEGGLSHFYGLLRDSTHVSIWSSDDTVSIFLQICY